MRPIKYFVLLLALLGLTVSTSSFAQSEDAETFTGIEEIIVTARKREEPLQETPVTITALTEEKIQKLYATDLKGLAMAVPNLMINQYASGGFTNSAAVFMRGIGNSDIDSTIDPPIGIFLDGIYVPRSSNSNLDLFDVEQVGGITWATKEHSLEEIQLPGQLLFDQKDQPENSEPKHN